MSKVTRIDIPAVDSALGNLNSIAARFEAAVAEMKRMAVALDGCWGNDEFGKKFAPPYLKQAGETLDNCDLTVTVLREMETNLRKVVRMFQELDSTSGGVLELLDK